MSHVYLISHGLTDEVRKVRAGYYTGARPPASTMLPFEGLPSLDAQMGVDVIAVADSASAQR
jgi:enamine deaminase RidA (YjgF/YER057c/UK114 family)